MKRFVLVQCAVDDRFPPEVFGRLWRATWAGRGCTVTIDVFFYAHDIIAAKKHVRDRFPDAIFTDEVAYALKNGARMLGELTAFILFFAAIAAWWILT